MLYNLGPTLSSSTLVLVQLTLLEFSTNTLSWYTDCSHVILCTKVPMQDDKQKLLYIICRSANLYLQQTNCQNLNYEWTNINPIYVYFHVGFVKLAL